MRIDREFFNRDARLVAKDLLGKILVRKTEERELKAIIVETEAYIGSIDKACHAYGGKMTKRTETLYHKAGTAYVYFIYGMHNCFNVITNKSGTAEGVLIRALEPLNEFEFLSQRRFQKSYTELTNAQKRGLTNGPSKLAKAFNITLEENKMDMVESEELYIANYDYNIGEVVETTRIGIDYAEEAKDFLWRYYIKGNKWVSKK